MRLSRLPVILLFAAFVCSASLRAATTNSWTWGGSGFWHHGTNWSLGVPGTNTSHAQIAVSGLSKTIIVDTNTALSNLVVNTLVMNSPGSGNSNWLVLSNLNDLAPFRVLSGANINGRGNTQSRLILHNSTLLFDSTNAGTLSSSNSAIIVNPNSSVLLSNGYQAKIGAGATGALIIATNARVHLTDSNFVAGINPGGFGTVTILGGTLDVGWTMTIGENAGSTGHVVVASGLLRAVNTNANTEIGQYGGGQLTLSNGLCQFDDVSVGRHEGARGTLRIVNGLMTGSDLSVGRFTNAVGVVNMTGGQMQFSGHIYVGREGTGTVSISGGTVQAQDLIVACTNTARGTATFSGGTSIFSSTLCIGGLQSTGNVTISGGTFISTNANSTGLADIINGTLAISGGNVFLDNVQATNTAGRVVITGGTLTADHLNVQNGSPLVIGNGSNAVTVRLVGGTNVFADGLVISSNVTIIGSGVIYGNVINHGTVIADTTNTALIFYGAVINNRTMLQTNGGLLDFRGPLANNGTIAPKNVMQNRIVDFRRNGTTNQIFFSTKIGFNYTVEAKDVLDSPVWQTLGTVPGNNATNLLLDVSASNQRFYRINIR